MCGGIDGCVGVRIYVREGVGRRVDVGKWMDR